MLRSQYGVATSSSVAPTASHAEDAQPNEVLYKRRHGRPPQIGSTWKNNYGDSGIQRGGYSGPWIDYGMRGNSLRGGRGNFQPNRGGHTNSNRHTSQVHSVPPIATLPDVEYRLPSSSSSSSSPIKPTHQPNSPETVIRDNDFRWLHRSRSPSPKLPQSVFKRRNIEYQPAPVHAPHSPEPLQVTTAVSSIVLPNILAETSTIKKEPRTPSPTLSRMERSLITSSCKFYPIPKMCRKSYPGFKENRNVFFKEKMQELTRLGLTKVRSFFRYVSLWPSPRCKTNHKSDTHTIRDDGLAIEWYAISLNFVAYLIYIPTGRVKSLSGLIPYFQNFQTSHQP